MSISKQLQFIHFLFCFRFKNLHFQDTIKCQKTIGKIKNLLTNRQNESSVEVEPSTGSQLSTSNNQSFDLWSYHTTVASLGRAHIETQATQHSVGRRRVGKTALPK